MLSVPTLALGLSILIINTSALPVPDVIEVRDLSPALSPRSEGSVELGSPVEKRQSPTSTVDINLVLSLLEGHGFLPTQGSIQTTSTKKSSTAKAITTAKATTTAKSITPVAVAKPTTTAKSTTPIVVAKPTTPIVVAKPSTTLKTTTKASVTPFLNLFGIPTVKTTTTKATTTPRSSTKATSTIKPTTTKRDRGLPLPRRTPYPARAVF